MKFESEWRGMGRGGKDLDDDDELMLVKDQPAKVFRLILLQMEPGSESPLKDVVSGVMEALGGISAHGVRFYRQKMASQFGLIYSRKDDEDNRWWLGLTDRGVDFINWLIHDKEDGQKWGLKTKFDLSLEEKRRYEQAFIEGNRPWDEETESGGGLAEIHDGVVQWEMGKWGLVLDDRIPRSVWGKIMAMVKKRGMRTVFVPDGYEVVVLDMVEEGGKAKRKARRVTRWSEFPIVDRQLIIDSMEGKVGDDAREELEE